MIVIAENLNVRNTSYIDAVRRKDRDELGRMARRLSATNADMINIQCSSDGVGDEETLPFVADAVQEASDCSLSLDSRNISALRKTVASCRNTPLINYASAEESGHPYEVMEIAARYRTNLVLRAVRGTIPHSLEAKMQILYDLIDSANAADIPNERLFADPSLVHMGHGAGQSHLVNSHRCIIVLKEIIDPPIRTVAWVSNVSSGIPGHLRSDINSLFLAYLTGAGLDAAMIDVLDPVVRKAVYLMRSFKDELVFTPADLA